MTSYGTAIPPSAVSLLVLASGTILSADEVATKAYVDGAVGGGGGGYVEGDDAIFNSMQLLGGTGLQGLMVWNADEETVDLVQNGSVLQVGQEVQIHCRNATGVTIPNGTVVMSAGTVGASGRIKIAPMIANGSVGAKFVLGITTEEILNGADGKVTSFGKVRQVDTSMWPEGTILYANPAVPGGLTPTKPQAPNLKLSIAVVVNSSSTVGTLFVRVDTGTDLGENHAVELINVSDKDVLIYNATTQRWENSTKADAGIPTINEDGSLELEGPFRNGLIPFSSLPSASLYPGYDLAILDRGYRKVYSNGTTWLWVADDTPAS